MDRYKRIFAYLSTIARNEVLAHAYIFYGPDDETKETLANKFASTILKSTKENINLDLLKIMPDENGRILIDKARDIKRFLSLKPASSHKVVIISKAERLKEDSQSTLLKILEEAPLPAVIIILSKTCDSLLPTIVSRSIKIPFWKKENVKSANENKGLLLKLIESSIAGRFTLAEEMIKKEINIKDIFYDFTYCLREFFLEKLKNSQALPINYTKEELVKLLAQVQNIYIKLDQTNLNPKYAFDELILALK